MSGKDKKNLSNSNKGKKNSNKDKKNSNKDKQDKYLSIEDVIKKNYDISSWKYDTYFNTFLKFNTVPFVRNLINNMYIDYSSVYRGNIASWLLTNNILKDRKQNVGSNINDDIVTVFSIKARNMSEIIYAFLYSRVAEKQGSKYQYYEYEGSNVVQHRMISTGPSFISSDGEYRGRLIMFNSFLNCRERYKTIFNDIINYLSEKIEKYGMRFNVQHFYPSAEFKKSESLLDYELLYNKLQMELFALCWFNDILKEKEAMVENNINEHYKNFMEKTLTNDIKFYNLLTKKYKKEAIADFRTLTTGATTGGIKYGQKIIPLNLLEVSNPFDITYKPWREYLITRRLSDCVISCQAPGFPLCYEWMYIKNSRKGLFDGESQYNRMEKSDMAKDVVMMLNRVHGLTGDIVANYKNKALSKDIKSSLLDKFKTLYNKIEIPINFALEEIMMSDIAFCIFTEYTGKTFIDSLILSKKSPYYRSFIGDILKSSDFKHFEKYMFDLCYSLYVMNNVGVIHGDLHLNNVTIRPKYYKEYRDIKKLKDPMELFVLGTNNKYTFITPTLGYNTSIIDFSRSLVDVSIIGSFADPTIPNYIFPVTNNVEKFVDLQNQTITNLYISLFPEMNDNRTSIIDILNTNFDVAFKLLTTIDIYKFTKNLIILFNANDKNLPKANPSIMTLLAKINRLSNFYLTTEFQRLISDKTFSNTIKQMDMPMMTIILKAFPHLLVDESQKYGSIIDVFNANHPLIYTLNNVDKTPDYIKDRKYYQRQKLASYEQYKLSDVKKDIIGTVKENDIIIHNIKQQQKSVKDILMKIKEDSVQYKKKILSL
jgi:hypothetical protein